MKFLTNGPLKLRTALGIIELKEGDTFIPSNPETLQAYINRGYIVPLDKAENSIEIHCWLERLSDSEREIFQERMKQYDGNSLKELAEVELIKTIIRENASSLGNAISALEPMDVY